jgi:hypothetical protein
VPKKSSPQNWKLSATWRTLMTEYDGIIIAG